MKLPLKKEFNQVIDYESDTDWHSDKLARMESKSKFYSNYRSLISEKLKGNIQIRFKIGNEEHNSIVAFDLDIFNDNVTSFTYDNLIDRINIILLNDFLNIVKQRVLLSEKALYN